LFLGTGTSLGVPVIGCDCDTCVSRDPRNFRTRCGLVLGLPAGNLLVDTPPDLWRQLVREGIGLVSATLFTHEHADHLFGLDDLRLFAHYLGHPVPIYCEPTVEARIRKSFDYAFAPEAVNIHPGGVPQLEFRRIGLEPFEVLGETVIPFRLRHGRFNVLGFRFGRVAYCTDTNGIPDESWPHLQDLDVLILDALRHTPHPTHFSLGQAIEVAKRVGAKKTIFTHISHDLEYSATNAALPPNMELAFDGMRIPLT
jgi:phosphoribosyl 1,2-cyclic phosphate phosphodiesterase